MEKIAFTKHHRFRLTRKRDGAGDSGSMLQSIKLCRDKDGNIEYDEDDIPKVDIENNCIRIGCAVKCGSFYARSYEAQDWWMTTPVTEFVKHGEDFVEFKTGNSYYTLKAF